MEYFCAEFICIEVKDNRDLLLLKLYESKSAAKFKNIIELSSDIDYASFRKSILQKCLNEYFEHLNVLKDFRFSNECDKDIWASISFSLTCAYFLHLTVMRVLVILIFLMIITLTRRMIPHMIISKIILLGFVITLHTSRTLFL